MFDLNVPESWRLVKLSDLGEVNRGRSRHRPRDAAHLYGGPYPFVQTGDVKASQGRVNNYTQTYSKDGLAQSRLWPKGTMCITIAANIAETGILQFPACFPDSVIGFIADETKCNVFFIEYVFRLLRRRIQAQATGSVQDNINLQTLERLLFPIPKLEEQNAIADILCSFDDKIELNRQTNQTLEHIAQAIFKSWFVDFEPTRAKIIAKQKGGNALAQSLAAQAVICGAITLEQLQALEEDYRGLEAQLHPLITNKFPHQIAGLDYWTPDTLQTTADLFPDALLASELGEVPEGWEVKALDEIAHYQNGLALQKFRPEDEGDFLPVLKIAQLKKGFADGEEKASPNIKPECIVDNGDVVFSWSGSLVVDVWCGGKAALNQHLFKVTSLDYPKWFYCYWTKHHLETFIQVAADKAVTMGHIKRSHLGEAKCVVPSCALDRFSLMSDFLEKQIEQRLESLSLQEIRDLLLPKLLSGEISLDNSLSTTEAVA